MADLIRDVLTGIGALTLLAFAALGGLAWAAWRRDQRARKSKLPPLDLPTIPPEHYAELHESINAFEDGEAL